MKPKKKKREFDPKKCSFITQRKEAYKWITKGVNSACLSKHKPKTVEKWHTIACQIFHRLWWDRSKNRIQRYKESLQGASSRELINHYNQLYNFPHCVKPLQQSLRDLAINKVMELIKTYGLQKEKDIETVKNLIISELTSIFPNGLDDIKGKVDEAKKRDKTYPIKRKLKRKAIETVLIPLIWQNIIREVKDNPERIMPSLT